MGFQAILKTPIGLIFSMVFLASLCAIIFERAINDLLLDYLSPWAVLGVAVLLLGFIPVLVHKRPFTPPMWAVSGFGLVLIYLGQTGII